LAYGHFGDIVLIAGMVSGVLGVVYAMGQHDLKRLAGLFSSVENIGIILIGIGIGMIGVAVDQPDHGRSGVWRRAAACAQPCHLQITALHGGRHGDAQTGTRPSTALGGLIKNLRITGVTFLVGSLAISGLPPFNGFVSEFFVYIGGFRASLSKMAPLP
jgi:hydrogenase-4 component B